MVGFNTSILAVTNHCATNVARVESPLPASKTATCNNADGSGHGKLKCSFQTQPPSNTSRTAVCDRNDRTETTANAVRADRFRAATTDTRSALGSGSPGASFDRTFPDARSRVNRATLNSPAACGRPNISTAPFEKRRRNGRIRITADEAGTLLHSRRCLTVPRRVSAWSNAQRAWSTRNTSMRTAPSRVGSKSRARRNAACDAGNGDHRIGTRPSAQFARPSNRRWSTDNCTLTDRALKKSACA